jgi:hypothetical protein
MLTLFLLAAVAAPDGKTMGADDWHRLEVVRVAVRPPNHSPDYLDVHAGDLDGDGLPDDAYLKLTCADGKLQQAMYQVSGPRDVATGQASGKRMHKPLTIVKEWVAASPELAAAKAGYDLKLEKKARMAGTDDGWTLMSVSGGDALCPALAAQQSAIIKSKSNITNN